MSFLARNMCPRIASSIETDKSTLLSGHRAADIRELLELRGVLVFPKIDMSDEEQVRFAQTIGKLTAQGEKGIYKVTLDEKVTPTAQYLMGTVLWHIDGFNEDVPGRGSILSARQLSAVGGQTEFANTYAAYDDLPDARKENLAKLKVVHTLEATQRDIFPNPSAEMRAGWAAYGSKTHPLVWTHRSGRKSLLLGSNADWVDGMDQQQGRALLAELQDWATQSQYVYRHEWQLGDMIIWDNCGTMHRVVPYAKDSGRLMHRTALAGEEAVA
jgi:alpha-ketoglutarate-dependent taurine dioxygenase